MNISKVVYTMEFYDGEEVVLKKVLTEQFGDNPDKVTRINCNVDTLLVAEQWNNIKHEMQKTLNISDVSYKTWIEPLKIIKVEKDVVFVSTPLKATVTYITTKYVADIQKYLSSITGKKYFVKVICPF